MKIIFATKNKNKLKEIRAIIGDVTSMEDAGIYDDVVEDGRTFEENALKKARHIMKRTGHASMADDSGLEIDFLNKEPGVDSALYMGRDTPYSIRNENLLKQLRHVPNEKRQARFVCVIALVLPCGRSFTTRETLEGRIAKEAAGELGFGYDPIFFLPEANKTLAELPPEDKNAISHRGKALRAMQKIMEEEL